MPARTPRFLTPEQVWLVADTVDERHRTLIVFAWQSGMWAGEIWALKRDKVHLLRRPAQVEVMASVREATGKGLITKHTKSERVRFVTIGKELADMLAAHMAAYPSADGYVFTSPDGHALRHHNFYTRVFGVAVEQIATLEGITFHDLRHSCASWMADQGFTREQVAAHLGHSDLRVTEKYTHLFPGYRDEIAAASDAALASDDHHPSKVRVADPDATMRNHSGNRRVVPMRKTGSAAREKGG
jgi:integrase